MSPTIPSHAFRMLAVAGSLGLASLVAPAATHAQAISPERALLNTTLIVSYDGVTQASALPHTVDGERALLGRSTAGASSQPTLASGSVREAQSVDGEQALLGKVAASGTRWLTVVR